MEPLPPLSPLDVSSPTEAEPEATPATRQTAVQRSARIEPQLSARIDAELRRSGETFQTFFAESATERLNRLESDRVAPLVADAREEGTRRRSAQQEQTRPAVTPQLISPETVRSANPPHAPAHGDTVLTLAEAAAFLRVSENDLRSMAESGNLPARRIGDEWRIAAEALHEWLRGDNRTPGT
jgi:excisionase family DNA binding protein